MNKINSVALLGGGGKTGRYIVTQLLNLGYHLKLLLRNPEAFELQDPRIEVIKGDATDIDDVHRVMQNCQATINTIGQRPGERPVHAKTSVNVLHASDQFAIHRYILIAGLNIDTPFDKKGLQTAAATEYMKVNFPEIHEDRQKSYDILSSSNSWWTMIRVPFIIFTGERGGIKVSLDDCPGNQICAGDIAAFVASQLVDNTYIGKCPFIASV